MDDFRKNALIQILQDEYNITSAEQLISALQNMKKIDITQFVLLPEVERNQNYDKSNINLPIAARA